MIKTICCHCRQDIVEPPVAHAVIVRAGELDETMRKRGALLDRNLMGLLVVSHKKLTIIVKKRHCQACVRRELDWAQTLIERAQACGVECKGGVWE